MQLSWPVGTGDVLAPAAVQVTSRKDQGQYWAKDSREYSYVPVTAFAEAFQKTQAAERTRNVLDMPYDRAASPEGALVSIPCRCHMLLCRASAHLLHTFRHVREPSLDVVLSTQLAVCLHAASQLVSSRGGLYKADAEKTSDSCCSCLNLLLSKRVVSLSSDRSRPSMGCRDKSCCGPPCGARFYWSSAIASSVREFFPCCLCVAKGLSCSWYVCRPQHTLNSANALDSKPRLHPNSPAQMSSASSK